MPRPPSLRAAPGFPVMVCPGFPGVEGGGFLLPETAGGINVSSCVSGGVPSEGTGSAGRRPEGRGRGLRSGRQRSDDLQLAPPGPDRPGVAAGFDNGRQRRTGRGEEAGRGAGGRAEGDETRHGAGPRSGGPKARYAAIKQMAAEAHVVQMCCRIQDVAESGYYDWLKRPPSPQAVRHALLIAVIREVHAASRGTYGVRRAPAELRLGRNLTVGHGQVEALMANARLKGVAGRPKWRRSAPDSRALDLVNRHSAATGSTRYGSQTSPNTRPVRARSIALPCWTPTPAGSSDGRSTLHRTLPW